MQPQFLKQRARASQIRLWPTATSLLMRNPIHRQTSGRGRRVPPCPSLRLQTGSKSPHNFRCSLGSPPKKQNRNWNTFSKGNAKHIKLGFVGYLKFSKSAHTAVTVYF
jgi:hypothetical protein